MITLNGKKFAETDSEFIDSVFTDKTCVGYAKRYARKINLYDHQKNLIGVVANNVLAIATLQSDGKYWYSYRHPDIIGDYKSYSEEIKELKSLVVANVSGKIYYKTTTFLKSCCV